MRSKKRPAVTSTVGAFLETASHQHLLKVSDQFAEGPGAVTIDTRRRKLYLSLGSGEAIEYGVGIGRQGFSWKGVAQIGRKAFWPGRTPPPEMLQRRPNVRKCRVNSDDRGIRGAEALSRRSARGASRA